MRAGVAAIVVMMLLLSGCGGSQAVAPLGPAPHPHQRVHVVQKGETLYYIAWRYAKDYLELAAINGITPPYTIYPGQRIRLQGPRIASTARARAVEEPREQRRTSQPANSTAPRKRKTQERTRESSQPKQKSQPVPATASSSRTISARSSASTRFDDNAPVTAWKWPARGPVITGFGVHGSNGIDIGGTLGEPVRAAAAGVVVYSGSGLIGYGKLIILKHNKHYLSAYAHNDRILVHEGDQVSLGQQIAEMGSSGADRVKLHFEIRRDGKPVDPMRYLPR